MKTGKNTKQTPSKQPLANISPIDGRYCQATQSLSTVFSEYALMKYRLLVEVNWLITLADNPDIKAIKPFDKNSKQYLNDLVTQFDLDDATCVKIIEKTTNHDVKAIEYFIKDKIKDHQTLNSASAFVHFACTSEDINNLAHALMLKEGRDQLVLQLKKLTAVIKNLAKTHSKTAMLARTHGQPASPTTLGKEMALFAQRLKRQIGQWQAIEILGKFNGAVGNYNAHLIAYPQLDWQQISQQLIETLALKQNPITSQIEPHDYVAEYFHALSRINTVLLDFSRDIWSYIAIDYFKQQAIAGEVGSSTMPHKINPIDFENAEGNLGLANALATHLAAKLPISRWQRDLSDSTVMRNLGVVCAYSLIAYQSLLKGLKKLAVNTEKLNQDLDNNWSVITEALQVVMRRYGTTDAYEQLKALSRGKKITQKTLAKFIDGLDLPNSVKLRLKKITPNTYVGNADIQAKKHSN